MRLFYRTDENEAYHEHVAINFKFKMIPNDIIVTANSIHERKDFDNCD